MIEKRCFARGTKFASSSRLTVATTTFSLFPNKPWFFSVCITRLLKTLLQKGEIARNEQFLLFPQCFLPIWKTFCHFHHI